MAIFAQMDTINPGGSHLYRNRTSSRFGNIIVTAENGSLKVVTPYSPTFVDELKSTIPATARKWDGTARAWFVSKDHAAALKNLIDRCYQCDVVMPTVIAADQAAFETTFQADYVANCRDKVANVHCNGGWNAKIPEKVLRSWFKQADTSAPATLYGLLGVDQTASDVEIKKAYKRAARQWHPDVCREPNAREMFETVKDAYQVLSDPSSRGKYNAGLMFEAMAKRGPFRAQATSRTSSFTPNLRCGKLTVKARRDLGVLIVEEILAWDDIVNEFGQTMVSFWAEDSWSVAWV